MCAEKKQFKIDQRLNQGFFELKKFYLLLN